MTPARDMPSCLPIASPPFSQTALLQPTSNKTGFDMGVPTFRWEAWADAQGAVHGSKDLLLDVGSGLGANALAALTERGRAVVAVDPSPNHVEHLREAAAEAGVPEGRLTAGVPALNPRGKREIGEQLLIAAAVLVVSYAFTVQGELPDLPPQVESLGPYAGILCAQVLHFLKPSLIPPAFRALFKVRRFDRRNGRLSLLYDHLLSPMLYSC